MGLIFAAQDITSYLVQLGIVVKLHSELANPTELQLDGVGVDFVSLLLQLTITTSSNPHQIYQKEVYYRDLTHKIKTM